MYFDAVTIRALVDELNARLAGGRVQDSVEIDEATFGMEVYAGQARHYLVLSAHQQHARVHLSSEKLRRGVQKPSPLGLLLRRYIEGARLERVHQPRWERVLLLEFDGPEGVFNLIAEPMERRANLLLVRDDGVIVDCSRRVGPQENRVRTSLPNHPYVPPPPQTTKRDPASLTLTLLGDLLDGAPGEQARQVLSRRVLGFSPQVAREVVHRATGSATTRAADASARALLAAIEDLFGAIEAGQWEPGNVVEDNTIAAYAAYRITHQADWEPAQTMSAALERYYGPLTGEGAYAAAKRPVQAALAEAQDRVRKKLESLRQSLQDEATLERLRQSGELLLAYQYTLAPGQTMLRAQYDPDGPELAIELDPALTPLENAQRYFERYGKAKRAREGVPALAAAAEQELAYLEQLESDLALATNWPEIGEVQEALQTSGYWRGKRVAQAGGGKAAPLKIATEDGFVIWVGRNARQNDIVTFDKGGPDDLWLHVRGVPGAHVIVKSGGRPVPDEVLRRAAALAAYYSPARTEARVLVDVTPRKHVRKIKGGKPGMVTYRNESPVEVTPAGE